MAGEKLEINIDDIQTQVSKIKEAIEKYKEIGNNPFDNEIEMLEGMNTDYIAKFKVMLEDLNDNNSDTFSWLDSILITTEDVIKNFEKIEEDMVSMMGFEEER